MDPVLGASRSWLDPAGFWLNREANNPPPPIPTHPAGSYTFADYDVLMANMTRVGIRKVIWCVHPQNRHYNTSTALPGDDAARRAFAAFVAAVVQRYDSAVGAAASGSGLGPGQGLTHWWEMANEPNLKRETTAPQYVAMVQQAAKAVRALPGGSKAVLVGPALADGGGTLEPAYLFNVSAILQDIDLLSVHLYRASQPETIYSLQDADVASVAGLRRFIQQRTNRSVDVISGEYGYTTCVNLQPGVPCHSPVREGTQANYLARMWLTALEANLRMANYYDWIDDCGDVTNREVAGVCVAVWRPAMRCLCFLIARFLDFFSPLSPFSPSAALAFCAKTIRASHRTWLQRTCSLRLVTRRPTGPGRAPRTTRAS